jgi:hypothetical protein
MKCGDGGAGLAYSISGTSTYYGGGGGGGSHPSYRGGIYIAPGYVFILFLL